MRNFVVTPTMTDRSTISVQKYLSEIKPYKILTPEEENEVAVKAFNGDENARQKLVTHNLRFVVSVAKQYQRDGIKVEDLINEGNIGLVKASHKFDPSKGFKFISFAVWSIRQQMLIYIQENSKTIRVPYYRFTRNFNMKKEYAFLEQKLQRTPGHNEIEQDLSSKGFTDIEIEFFIDNFNRKMVSLDSPLNDDSNSATIIDLVVKDVEGFNPSDLVNLSDSEIRTNTLLKKLDDEEKTVMILLYGLNGDEPLNIKEISNMLGLTKAKVALLRDKSLRRLKYQLLHDGKWLKKG